MVCETKISLLLYVLTFHRTGHGSILKWHVIIFPQFHRNRTFKFVLLIFSRQIQYYIVILNMLISNSLIYIYWSLLRLKIGKDLLLRIRDYVHLSKPIFIVL
jgi:hypothetical protein